MTLDAGYRMPRINCSMLASTFADDVDGADEPPRPRAGAFEAGAGDCALITAPIRNSVRLSLTSTANVMRSGCGMVTVLLVFSARRTGPDPDRPSSSVSVPFARPVNAGAFPFL